MTYNEDSIVDGTDIQWNDEEGVSVYEKHNGNFGLYYWVDGTYSAAELGTLEEAQDLAERATRCFHAAAGTRELAGVL